MSKSSKGGKKKGDSEEQAAEEKRNNLEIQAKILKHKLVLEQEKADKAKAGEMEARGKFIQLQCDLKAENDKLFTITSDMTRQYKHMQDDLNDQIDKLKKELLEKNQTIDQKIIIIKEMEQEHDYKLKKKDDEINDLKKKIEDMSNEFARMLRETLDKMQERIELAQWDNETDPQMMKRLKDIAGISNN